MHTNPARSDRPAACRTGPLNAGPVNRPSIVFELVKNVSLCDDQFLAVGLTDKVNPFIPLLTLTTFQGRIGI